ncbi:M16 family metallopeptidase [Virgisporangium aurantiacum]|uniref:Peptidase M16 n=1 Tax=Virgisporangium aurantiacum TaxID=175570 RepID=A0A8J3ZLX6_9ACTN|nr:pitrilysin family protein [Virgisporangium aurantiacum]GIJ63953.1 peptidase M16 [Virgisporangium aurantiacum]
MNPTRFRSAWEIGRTVPGPRPLPPLRPRRPAEPPATADVVLDNGLRVLAARLATAPTVELRLYVPFAGPDPTHLAGADLLATALFSGTARRDRDRMETELGSIGGTLAAEADQIRLLVAGHGPASGLPLLLDHVADVLTGATYPEPTFTRDRDRCAQQRQAEGSQPQLRARAARRRHCYGDHPLGWPIPQPAHVLAIDVEWVRQLHRRAVVPRGSILVVVGDLHPDAAVEAAAGTLADWRSERVAAELAPAPAIGGAEPALVHQAGAVLSQIRLCAPAVSYPDRRYPALQLANQILGGYFSSRLVANLRERQGFTYSVRSAFEHTPGGAAILIDTDTANEVVEPALAEIGTELAGLGTRPPSAAEVAAARQYTIGNQQLAAATQAGLASSLLTLAAAGLDAGWPAAHAARLEGVTVDDVGAAAMEFLAPGRCAGVVIGDATAWRN